jgi:hypothetical protein
LRLFGVHSDVAPEDTKSPTEAADGSAVAAGDQSGFLRPIRRAQLTSYGGLGLLRRFFGLIGLKARIQCAFAVQRLGGDYGASHLVSLVICLLKALV